ncbi:hypothetical protein CZ794_13885 [Psychrobacter sp. JB385]|nr:hypothetical protein CZ794_13885 [Psychrobacter sp. JB385]
MIMLVRRLAIDVSSLLLMTTTVVVGSILAILTGFPALL